MFKWLRQFGSGARRLAELERKVAALEAASKENTCAAPVTAEELLDLHKKRHQPVRMRMTLSQRRLQLEAQSATKAGRVMSSAQQIEMARNGNLPSIEEAMENASKRNR
jgi:hypothetical protein